VANEEKTEGIIPPGNFRCGDAIKVSDSSLITVDPRIDKLAALVEGLVNAAAKNQAPQPSQIASAVRWLLSYKWHGLVAFVAATIPYLWTHVHVSWVDSAPAAIVEPVKEDPKPVPQIPPISRSPIIVPDKFQEPKPVSLVPQIPLVSQAPIVVPSLSKQLRIALQEREIEFGRGQVTPNAPGSTISSKVDPSPVATQEPARPIVDDAKALQELREALERMNDVQAAALTAAERRRVELQSIRDALEQRPANYDPNEHQNPIEYRRP
jgi:hypothetical protein